MNKKRLSVVMAGAMLASSVSPVLAAEEVAKSEVTLANKGLLIKELTDAIWEAPRFSNDPRVNPDLKGKSVYTIKVAGSLSTTVRDASAKSKTALQKAIQTALSGLVVGNKVELVNYGYRKVTEGDKEYILSTDTSARYTESELKSTTSDSLYGKLAALKTVTNFSAVVKDFGYNYDREAFVITLNDDINNSGLLNRELVLEKNDVKIDTTKYKYSSKGDGTDTVEKLWSEEDINSDQDHKNKFFGFVESNSTSGVDIADSTEKIYTIIADAASYELKDLYDGVMLTEKGQDLLSLAKDARDVAIAKKNTISSNNEDNAKKAAVKVVDINAANGVDITSASVAFGYEIGTNLVKDKDGNYKISVELLNPYRANTGAAGEYDSYTITSDDQGALKLVAQWLDGAHARVDELSGEDRYETAVKISKEVANLKTVANSQHIVLVNGNSLVDGLAAAPLAHKLGGNTTPILLTETNSLPKATKVYLQELVDAANNNQITVHIVGGTGVVSDSVKKELKQMNLKVERLAGSDRQETSLAVAEKIASLGAYTDAFVVGATGEADAMSVAGKAASMDAPIIVSGFEGLSDEALEGVEKKTVHVIGGDSAVSEDNFKAIKDVATKVRRISGSDRKATNAAVINTFYGTSLGDGTNVNTTTKSVLVAKDDVLIDALTASSLASKQNAPIVLATNSLSTEQLNAVVKNAQYAKDLYQIGGGVAREVVKTVAQALGLA